MQHLWEGLSGEVASEQRLTGERNPEDPGGGASSRRRRVAEPESCRVSHVQVRDDGGLVGFVALGSEQRMTCFESNNLRT